MYNTFASAMISSEVIPNRNGGGILLTSGDKRVDAFNNLNKETDEVSIKNKICDMIAEMKSMNDEPKGEYVSDLFRIWVHKRHAREGEKEKLLSYRYFLELYEHYPETCVMIARSDIFGEIGYWKDFYLIWGIINKKNLSERERFNKYDNLIKAFRHSILTQRTIDLNKIKDYISIKKLSSIENSDLERLIRDCVEKSGKKLSVSYVGKYCVREKSNFNKELFWYTNDGCNIKRESHVSYMVRGSLKIGNGNGEFSKFPLNRNIPFNAKKTYRNMNSKLNIVLNVPECLMCADRFGEMEPETFPSVFMKKNAKALLNEKLKVSPDIYEEDTGNRDPYNEGRIQLREKMRHMFSDPSRMNSSQVFPHEICHKVLKSTSTMEKDMFNTMWQSKIIETKSKLDDRRLLIISEMKEMSRGEDIEDKVRLAITSGNFIGCADVSGSMTSNGKEPNRPIDIAIGLTLFMSEIASEQFRDLAISFTTEPRIMNFSGKTLEEKMNIINNYVGYSTNYEGMHRVLIDMCIKKTVKEEDIPIIVVYTDGDFNQMDPNVAGKWDTIHNGIMSMWVSAGYSKVPTIVYWNLNSQSLGVQTSSKQKGVMFLQGRSATNIKYILYGECAEDSVAVVNGQKVKVSSVTPYEIFRKAMEGDHFRDLEKILHRSNEGVIAHIR